MTENVAVAPTVTVWLTGCTLIEAPFCTVRVKDWSLVPLVLVALTVKVKGEPVVLDGGVAVSNPAELKVATALGRVPETMLKVGDGEPVATNWKVPAVLTENAVLLALVITGA